MIVEQARSNASFSMNYLMSTSANLENDEKFLRRHEIEWHRKLTLSIACLIFLFVGAPLGAIIRKGGLGMPTVISTVFFIIYYIISLSGEKFVRESVLTGLEGMWLSSFILIVAGVFLTYEATNDSAMLNLDTYLTWLRTKLGLKKSMIAETKSYLAGKFDYVDIEKSEVQDYFRNLVNQAGSSLEKLEEDTSLKKIFKRIMTNRSYEYMIETGVMYNGVFHDVMLSNWYRMPYFKKRIEEFPVLHYKTNSKSYTKKWANTLSIIVFPVFIFRFIKYLSRLRRLRKELQLISSLSNGMVNLLDRAIIKSYFQGA
jgi:lipopolysaccharide export system permease protein